MTSGRKLLVIEEKRLELGNLLSSGDFGSVYKVLIITSIL